MGIFRRRSQDETTPVESEDVDVRRDDDTDDLRDERDSASDGGLTDDRRDDADRDADEASEGGYRRVRRGVAVDRTSGPFDESELDDFGEHLDLGALAIRPEAGAELRLDVDEQEQTITGVTVVMGEAACQLQAFAAPKSTGLWDDIRDELADNLIGAGGTAQEEEGPLGIELHARMPSRDESGRTTYAPVRFLGVDGPRWFLRAVLSGRAAVDDEAAAQMVELVRTVVVRRGKDPRAPRELLELSIPQQLIDMQQEQQRQEAAQADDFKPFERGPEITEVR